MKKQLSLVAAISLANVAIANDAFDKFLEDTTVDLKARSIVVQMSPNDVVFDTQYDANTAALILMAIDPTQAAYFAGLVSGSAANPADVAAGLTAADGLAPGTLAAVNAAINDGLETSVETEGKLDQAGSALWGQIESGYLFDIIGFDLGFQGGLKHFKEDESTKLIIGLDDEGNAEESYSRLSTARLKLRYGSEDVYVKGHYGIYSSATETDYLMDESENGYGASAHFKGFNLAYDAVTAKAGNTESELVDYDEPRQTIEASYESNFGKASFEREFTQDVDHTDSYSVATGLPLSLIGLPIPEGKMMDYLLLAQVDYANAKRDADDDYNATQYEITLAAKLDGITLAASYNQASEDGGADVANIVDNALINSFDMPDQTTISYALNFDGSMVNIPGLIVSVVHLTTSGIDKDALLASGDLSYYLTGDAEFTETLVDASYSFSENSFLKGLSLRTVFGGETNQANVSGYGVFVDYSLSF